MMSGQQRTWQIGSHRQIGYATLLLLVVGLVQVAASLLFYEAIDRQAMRDDHARRVAELLVVSDRVHRFNPAVTAATMSTRHLDAAITAHPAIRRPGTAPEIAEIYAHIVDWEPGIAQRRLMLDSERDRKGQRHLVGSMQLTNGAWLNFRSRDISTGWPIVLRATMMTLLITLICIVAGVFALNILTKPLRRLSEAVATIGEGHLAPVEESGPSDLRSLARSFNDMQARIAGLVEDQARSFEAISHDLRTPLSRLKLASDFVAEGDVARIVSSSADEMEMMLMSLQRFLRAQHLEAEPEPIDLAEMLRVLLAPHEEADTSLVLTGHPQIMTVREPLMLALEALIENALQYGDAARIAVMPERDRWRIEIADDGPGIAEDYFEAILDPFFRLDSARMRNTAGFGLGIPTAHRLLQRFGGALSFRNGENGGLVVSVIVPQPAH
jgi:signal transduction histidine kinase